MKRCTACHQSTGDYAPVCPTCGSSQFVEATPWQVKAVGVGLAVLAVAPFLFVFLWANGWILSPH